MAEPLLATEATPTTEGQTTPDSGDSSSPETTQQPQQVDDQGSESTGAPEAYEFATPEGLPAGARGCRVRTPRGLAGGTGDRQAVSRHLFGGRTRTGSAAGQSAEDARQGDADATPARY